MSKFCKYCGKELEDGEICSCGGEKAVQTESASETKNIKSQMKGIWTLFKAFIKKPVSVGTQFVNDCNVKQALGIIGVQSLLVALLVMSLAGKYNSAIKNLASLASGGNSAETTVSSYVFSLPTVFIITAVAAFAIACLLAAVLMLIIKIFKGNTRYDYMVCVSSINSLALIPFIVCGLLVSLAVPMNLNLNLNDLTGALSGISSVIGGFFKSLILPISIASIGIMLGSYIVVNIISGGSDVNREVLPYIVFLESIVMAIIWMFMLKAVTPMCLPPAINETINEMHSAEVMSYIEEADDSKNYYDYYDYDYEEVVEEAVEGAIEAAEDWWW